MSSRALFVAIALVASGCSSPDAPSVDSVRELEVSSALGSCLGNSRMACLQVRASAGEPWQPAQIQEFNYVEGYRYRVEVTVLPATAPMVSGVYRLRRVLTQDPTPSP